MSDTPFKEFTELGWPLCPRCGEDELYSFLMLTWTDPDSKPSVEDCIATGMKCYRCSWELQPLRRDRLYPDCFRCGKPFDLREGEPQYIYCPPCRELMRAESAEQRVRAEVAAMGWPDEL